MEILRYELRRKKTCLRCFRPGPRHTNWAVQPRKIRGLTFWIYEVEELYFQCSENKGVDQLHSYHTADLAP